MYLLSIEADNKTSKNTKFGYLTGVLYLSPYTNSGRNVCGMAEAAQCFRPCLDTAGRGNMNTVQQARINRTNLLYNSRQEFLDKLNKEIDNLAKRAAKRGLKPAVRLNGLSDLPWHKPGFGSIPLRWPSIQFYDYTKYPNRRDTPENYYQIWSYSRAEKYLEMGVPHHLNWSVVFDGPLPTHFGGRPVVDGDTHDLRFLDPTGSVVGLKAKGRARGSDSPLVVNTRDRSFL